MPKSLTKEMIHFTFPPAKYDTSSSSVSTVEFGGVTHFDFSYSGQICLGCCCKNLFVIHLFSLVKYLCKALANFKNWISIFAEI